MGMKFYLAKTCPEMMGIFIFCIFTNGSHYPSTEMSYQGDLAENLPGDDR